MILIRLPFSPNFETISIILVPFSILDYNQDRLATIIHRGRDHGLPTYTQVRESCGFQPVTTFKELNNTIEMGIVRMLEEVYANVVDIDLFIGGLAERPLSGAAVGPTFGCLLGQQFQILKKGDRYNRINFFAHSLLKDHAFDLF